MPRQTHKFIGFFKLIEAMGRPGCPVCRRLEEETHHAMESFLYESVNDPGLRNVIRRDRGLCRRHSWQLAGFGDALGGAILFRDILESLLPKIESMSGDLTGMGGQVCFFCRQERQTLEGLLGELSQHLEDSEVRKGWEGPAVLCIRHLAQVHATARRENPGAADELARLHRAKYAVTCEQMKELVVKQSYEHAREEAGAERDSWLRAIEALVGRGA